jgi:CHAD domain-containing protein
VACYTHMLDMPNCRDCERSDPHRLRAEIQRLRAEFRAFLATVERYALDHDAQELGGALGRARKALGGE